MKAAYAEHIAQRRRLAEVALSQTGFDACVYHAGTPLRYHADDQDAPFRPNPHFAHWVPLRGPYHLLVASSGERPKLLRVSPEDYWYEQPALDDPLWASEFDLVSVTSEEEAWRHVPSSDRVAYVGDSPASAGSHRIDEAHVNPEALIARLDWDRSFKTAYEIACLDEASRLGGLGHQAAKRAFEAGASELEIHHAFVAAAGCVDRDLPYGTIVALDEKGAILHYEGKRAEKNGSVLLIDCGAAYRGYGSDITRTWTVRGCPSDFVDLVGGMNEVQQELCRRVRPGLPYGDLHHAAHVLIADLLHRCGILKRGGEDAVADGLTQPFFPHGLGHFLGIQTHDVAGHQAAPEGGRVEPPPRHPFLRTTRTIAEHQVFTVEPGVYFIEMLLRPHRDGPRRADFDWDAIDRLAPCGGIRIEDNVVVTADGHRNLTRPYV